MMGVTDDGGAMRRAAATAAASLRPSPGAGSEAHVPRDGIDSVVCPHPLDGWVPDVVANFPTGTHQATRNAQRTRRQTASFAPVRRFTFPRLPEPDTAPGWLPFYPAALPPLRPQRHYADAVTSDPWAQVPMKA